MAATRVERRGAATARSDKEACVKQMATLREEVEEARRREEAATRTNSLLRRELAELKASYASTRESSSNLLRIAQQQERDHVASLQRDVALDDVAQLAQELESLQAELGGGATASPAPRSVAAGRSPRRWTPSS